jgi:hypothetical protein
MSGFIPFWPENVLHVISYLLNFVVYFMSQEKVYLCICPKCTSKECVFNYCWEDCPINAISFQLVDGIVQIVQFFCVLVDFLLFYLLLSKEG